MAKVVWLTVPAGSSLTNGWMFSLPSVITIIALFGFVAPGPLISPLPS